MLRGVAWASRLMQDDSVADRGVAFEGEEQIRRCKVHSSFRPLAVMVGLVYNISDDALRMWRDDADKMVRVQINRGYCCGVDEF